LFRSYRVLADDSCHEAARTAVIEISFNGMGEVALHISALKLLELIEICDKCGIKRPSLGLTKEAGNISAYTFDRLCTDLDFLYIHTRGKILRHKIPPLFLFTKWDTKFARAIFISRKSHHVKANDADEIAMIFPALLLTQDWISCIAYSNEA